jgi:hypothetical protein
MGSVGNRHWLGAAFFALAAPLACGGTSLRGGDNGSGSETGGSGGSNSNAVPTITGTSGAWTNGAQAIGGKGDAGSLPVLGGAGFGSMGGVGGAPAGGAPALGEGGAAGFAGDGNGGAGGAP